MCNSFLLDISFYDFQGVTFQFLSSKTSRFCSIIFLFLFLYILLNKYIEKLILLTQIPQENTFMYF